MKENCDNNIWHAPSPDSLPDFIIGGSMKSGTSTLHEIIGSHPSVGIPDKEIGFFDIDEIMEHPDFNFYNSSSKNWVTQSMQNDPNILWQWYTDKFIGFDNTLIGEDSTTYLSSINAANRIGQQKKDIKIIFVLRQPTDRAYSNYLHLLKTGRARYSFEDTIRFEPFSVLNRSDYQIQLDRFYDNIEGTRIHIIDFDDLINNTKSTIQDVCCFLSIDASAIPVNAYNSHAKKAINYRSNNFQLLKNRLFFNNAHSRYFNSLPNKSELRTSIISKLFNNGLNVINQKSSGNSSKINPNTETFLNQYFASRLDRIDEITGLALHEKWFK